MKASSALAFMIVFMIVGMMTSAAHATCRQGVYRSGSDVVALVPDSNAPSAQRYLFLDGRRGSTADAAAPVKCSAESVAIDRGNGRLERSTEVPMKTTDTTFSSVATELKGRLIEPSEEAQRARPLVVMVHGSEHTSALNSVYAYVLAAQDISVFVYDKRGTGGSEGEYTQNFELLAADAAAALAHARTMMRGRFNRSGYFGGSQGGWVAPLAATRSSADFVAVGFGLVASPIEEDREQMFSEARAMGRGEDAIALLDRLSRATARLLLTDFKQGYEDLAKVRSELSKQPWLQRIRGEYSGAMLRMSEEELRRVGRPRFDNVELIWDYDSIATLQRLEAPLLWVLAEDDREAPIETTRAALLRLIEDGKQIDVYVFPDTDHGMMEYVTNADGSRKSTRITEGYLRLLGDWINGDLAESYGRGLRIRHE